jgi:hypothetical protein
VVALVEDQDVAGPHPLDVDQSADFASKSRLIRACS